ncbi:hypothetical protein N7504_010880 [Penicillium tannophilum]|nr:hypothetical protein N7504_010880 [Penicillium tannophilum]
MVPILLILTIISFLPQILRIQKKQTTSGISSLCVLWNLICATEQLTIYIYALFFECEPEGNVFLHSPPSAGDRFSLCHCAVVTILFLALFAQVLFYSSRRASLLASYTSFLVVSIIPLFVLAILPIDDEGRRFWSAVFYALHTTLVYPILTALGVLGIYRQAREIVAIPLPNALSLQGLVVQALVFILISVTWTWSLPFPYEELESYLNWNIFSAWYSAIGWIIVDNFVFALGQIVLLLWALHCSSSRKASMQSDSETEPLLGHPVQE